MNVDRTAGIAAGEAREASTASPITEIDAPGLLASRLESDPKVNNSSADKGLCPHHDPIERSSNIVIRLGTTLRSLPQISDLGARGQEDVKMTMPKLTMMHSTVFDSGWSAHYLPCRYCSTIPMTSSAIPQLAWYLSLGQPVHDAYPHCSFADSPCRTYSIRMDNSHRLSDPLFDLLEK